MGVPTPRSPVNTASALLGSLAHSAKRSASAISESELSLMSARRRSDFQAAISSRLERLQSPPRILDAAANAFSSFLRSSVGYCVAQYWISVSWRLKATDRIVTSPPG